MYSGTRLRFVKTQQALSGPRVDIFEFEETSTTSPYTPYTCWTGERKAQFGYAVALDGNERFGGLRNLFTTLRKMTVHVYRVGCSIEFPTELIVLESFTPPCTLIRLHGTLSSPNRTKCPVLEPKVRVIGARVKAESTNGVADVSLALVAALLQQLISSNDNIKRSNEEMKLDVAELKLQCNDHSVKARTEAGEEMLQRMCHGLVHNVARRLSQSTTMSRELVDSPVIDYVPTPATRKAHMMKY